MDRIRSLPLKTKVALVAVLLLGIAAVVLLLAWAHRPDYQLLYSNLPQEDASAIIQQLESKRVPYKVTPRGLMVPADQVYRLRMELAGDGYPRGSGVGFELFDRSSFTMTDFLQKINYRRALQGELARTIGSITAVERCRVHLVIPQKTLFPDERETPKASVFVWIKPGQRLTPKQIQGITHLVAGSVEGLSPEGVTVVDQNGETLTHPVDPELAASQTQLEFQRNYERDLERRVVRLLEPVVGRGNVRAKVTVDMDFTSVEQTEENFDPDAQVVRSERRTTEKSTKGGTGGVPGVASNVPDQEGKASSSTAVAVATSSEKTSETINYEINKVTRHRVTPPGRIRRLAAVVLIDSSFAAAGGGGGEGQGGEEPDLAKFEEMVKNAVGFSAERGDTVKVMAAPFRNKVEVPEPPAEEEGSMAGLVLKVARTAAPYLVILLVVMLVLRPLAAAVLQALKTPAPALAPQEEGGRVTVSVHEGEPGKLGGGGQEEPSVLALQDPIKSWAEQNPKEAARLVRRWLERK